jgi:hypothetical protein
MHRSRSAASFLLIALSAHFAGAAGPNELPKFEAVTAIVHKELAKHKGYRANDILTSEQVAGALHAVETTGWKIKDRDAIAGSFLAEGDFLVRQLRTPRGTAFMRRFSNTPLAYDRIDRLRHLPRGKRRIPELINNPGGHTLILYMATTRGGRTMGRQLNNLPGVENFNKPTPRLYTETQLLERLKISHDLEVKSRTFGRAKKKAVKKRAGA